MALIDEMEAQIHIGPRVRALREAMDLSLRDLAERSGVSAPMLSQVERGETSPTLQIASRIAAGLELRLSQLLRLDESGTVTVVRAGERRVAAMAADGLSNTQIAQALFVSTRTVEGHLTHVFRKLDVTARTELRERMR